MKPITGQEAQRARRFLADAWPSWIRTAVDEERVRLAEGLAWEHGLRGYDAVHLAAARAWSERLDRSITVATFDRALWELPVYAA
jgi:predicted nucleic acid-binding protein